MASTEYETSFSTELVCKAQSGDEAAFNLLFDTCYEKIRALAFRIVLDVGAADDVAQETFIRVSRQLRDLRDPQTFMSWILRIAANLSRDHLRARASRERRIEMVSRESPAQQFDESNASYRIHKALAKLPQAQREAVALVYFENLNHAEASQCLGCAESTISWRIFLAKRTLKKLLKS